MKIFHEGLLRCCKKFDPLVLTAFDLLEVTDAKQEIDDINDAQIILEVDGKVGSFLLGIENRQIGVKPITTVGFKYLG
ncbi:MAG: hypothetical protein VW995_19180, partial [Deltaproteobacteria bacterium]